MSRAEIKRLDQEVEDRAITFMAEGDKKTGEIAGTMGMSVQQYWRYRKKFPDFDDDMREARARSCAILEDEMRAISKYIRGDPKEAAVRIDALAKLLRYRDPKVYGEKLNIDQTVTIDIAGSLDRAQARLDSMRDVTNVIAITGRPTET